MYLYIVSGAFQISVDVTRITLSCRRKKMGAQSLCHVVVSSHSSVFSPQSVHHTLVNNTVCAKLTKGVFGVRHFVITA